MPNIVSLEVMCAKDHMDVHMTFSHPFEGIVSSKNQHSDPRCIYVPPSSGKTFFSFRISYSRCGTKPDLNGQFYENTVSWLLFIVSIKLAVFPLFLFYKHTPCLACLLFYFQLYEIKSRNKKSITFCNIVIILIFFVLTYSIILFLCAHRL